MLQLPAVPCRIYQHLKENHSLGRDPTSRPTSSNPQSTSRNPERRASKSVKQNTKLLSSSPRRSRDRIVKVRQFREGVERTVARQAGRGSSHSAGTPGQGASHPVGMPVASNVVAGPSSIHVPAIEDARFTEHQIRETVKRQLAVAQAEAHQVHAERIGHYELVRGLLSKIHEMGQED